MLNIRKKLIEQKNKLERIKRIKESKLLGEKYAYLEIDIEEKKKIKEKR